MQLALLLAGAAFLALTFLPLYRNPVWWIRAWEFPRLQLAIMIALLLGLALSQAWTTDPGTESMASTMASWSAVGMLGIALGWQIWRIIPYSVLYRTESRPSVKSDPENRIRVLSSNVLMTNRSAHKLIELVDLHSPDILIALETDRWWESQLDQLNERYPHACKCPLDNLYGMHVYSALPIEDAQTTYLVESDKPSMHMLVHLRSGHKIRLHVLHPAPPSPTENETASERDAELVMVGMSVADAPHPVIIAGDMNDVAWSHTTRLLRRVSGLSDPRIGRGMYNTFHAGLPFLRYPLDHFFHSSHFTVAHLERLQSIDSDHFPMMIDLQLELGDRIATRADESSGPEEADAEDHDEAREIMADESVDPSDVPVPGARA